MTSAAQNSLVAFRPLPLPSEVKTSTFSILPIVISEPFRQLGGYFTLSQVPCPCYFSTFSIPKSKPINGQAPPLPYPLSATAPSPPPLPHFLEVGIGQTRRQWSDKGLVHHPAKLTRRKWPWASVPLKLGPKTLKSSFARSSSVLHGSCAQL